jgi:protein phosphatase 2C family protein 2/3
VANVGDSRGVISSNRGALANSISEDHKPGSKTEHQRIYRAGGQTYRSRMPMNMANTMTRTQTAEFLDKNFGPERVAPGKLSVSRTIGDLFAKDFAFGGNPKVVIPDPEIYEFLVGPEDDFVILASDGIFDTLSTKEVIKIAWDTIDLGGKLGAKESIHQ